MRGIFAAGVGGVAAVWLALFCTSHAMLFGSWRHRYSPTSQEVLTCSYFTGLRVLEVEYWYSPTGTRGVAQCPALHDLSDADAPQPQPSFNIKASAG